MSLFIPLRRATLLIPSGPLGDPDRRHLFVLLTDPQDNETGIKHVLMASLSTVKTGVPYDPTCLLYAGDHSFVKHDSYVVYQKARLEEVPKVQRGVESGQFVPHDRMDGAIFARICKGLEESRHTPLKLLDFYRKATGQA